MSERILNIWRGIPGSGKSTLAKKAGGVLYEADQYFLDKAGNYHFNPKKLKDAHAWCREQVEEAMMFLKPVVNVANTFTQLWEFESYIELAKSHGYEVKVFHVKGNWRNVHNVPSEAVKRMSDRWEAFDRETIVENFQ
jgi:predicted kinase